MLAFEILIVFCYGLYLMSYTRGWREFFGGAVVVAAEETDKLKIIPISELKPGMQVVDAGLDWMKRPYMYAREHCIKSQEEIDAIAGEGFLEVYVDISKSGSGPESDFAPPPQGKGPLVSLEEEMPIAVKAHDEGVSYARRFMDDMRAGKLNISDSAPVVENILKSLERNPDALLSLSRLRRKDAYTYTHCLNVSILATAFVKHLGQPDIKCFAAGNSGLFHDLGKSLIPESILNAPRALADKEMEVMRKHPVLGYEELAKVEGVPQEVLDGALEHHEKYNGTGYPKGLKNDQISFFGKVVGISDVYDALTSRRVYKKGMYPHKALGFMYELREKEFALDTISEFIRMVGIYPVGSVVTLQDGSMGVVSASNAEKPTQPEVIITRDPKGRIPAARIQKIAGKDLPAIVQCIPEIGTGIDPRSVLGIPLN